ncbi:MAG: chemotaxis response regulator protein-glutamate methylesterase, partial [Firmicutes bacterium]|nr:chemotaxis response regulator protein-glutamate methylesterase [Bacillota bacterium]
SIILAAAGGQLHLNKTHCWMEVDSTPRLHPSLDVTLPDMSAVFHAQWAAVILTGMGCDGVHAALDAFTEGATIIAESQETALIWGMPGAVVKAGAASAVWPRGRIADWLKKVATG